MYPASSAFEFFHVMVVELCAKPIFASVVIIDGRVNASARKITSGCFERTSEISHSQNGTGFVCGLSTRNTVIPRCTQKSTTSRSADHSPSQSSDSKLTL